MRGRHRHLRLLTGILCGALLIPVCQADEESAKSQYSNLENGDIISVSLDQLLPTQAVLDYDAIFANLQRYANDPANMFNDLCRLNGAQKVKSWTEDSMPTNPDSYTCTAKNGSDADALATVVVGPENGVLYLTSRLTALSTFWDMPNGGTSVPITVKVSHNLIESGDDFWAEMNHDNAVWLYDFKGKKVSPDDLPEYIGMKQLKHDKYLTLVNLLNGISYTAPKPDGKDNTSATVPFLHLQWALELRKQMKISEYDLNDPEEFATALTEAATIMVDLPDDQEIGKSKRTALMMGQFDQVDSKALEALLTNEKSPFGLSVAYRLAQKVKSTPKVVLEEEKAKKEKANKANSEEKSDSGSGKEPNSTDKQSSADKQSATDKQSANEKETPEK